MGTINLQIDQQIYNLAINMKLLQNVLLRQMDNLWLESTKVKWVGPWYTAKTTHWDVIVWMPVVTTQWIVKDPAITWR